MKKFLGLLVVTLFVPIAAAAEKLPLSQISDYLNGLDTAQASFTQFNDDGSRSTGTLYLNRPGRMRFEYDPPNEALVVSGGSTVVIFDRKSNQPPESYPLNRTPLSLILARVVDLDRADMVVGHTADGDDTVVVAQDPENPDYGRIDLYFSEAPVALKKWVIHDGGGGRTTVVLDKLNLGIRLRDSLFDPSVGSSDTDR